MVVKFEEIQLKENKHYSDHAKIFIVRETGVGINLIQTILDNGGTVVSVMPNVVDDDTQNIK